MDRDTIAVLVAVDVVLRGILGAIFLLGSNVYYSRRNKSAPLKAEEILKHCQKVLQDTEPELGKQTEFLYATQIIEWGRFPWQKEVFLDIVVKPPKSERLEALKTAVLECITYSLDLPANYWLWAEVDFNREETSLEK